MQCWQLLQLWQITINKLKKSCYYKATVEWNQFTQSLLICQTWIYLFWLRNASFGLRALVSPSISNCVSKHVLLKKWCQRLNRLNTQLYFSWRYQWYIYISRSSFLFSKKTKLCVAGRQPSGACPPPTGLEFAQQR